MDRITTKYRFNDWLIEPGLNHLRRDEEVKPLEPLAMNVLTYLLANAGEVVTIDELLKHFWSDRNAESGLVSKCINQIRRALGDSARSPVYVETIWKRGYRAIAEVETIEREPSTAESRVRNQAPTVRVKELDHQDESDEFSRLANAIGSGLATRLLHHNFSVVMDKGESVEGSQAICHYLLGGSFQEMSKQARISIGLISLIDNKTIWSQEMDISSGVTLASQDQLLNRIDQDLREVLLFAEQNRQKHLADEELDAWGLCARSYIPIVDHKTFNRVRSLLELSVQLDDEFAFALSLLGELLVRGLSSGFSNNTKSDCDQALDYANRAIALGHPTESILNNASCVYRVLADPHHALHLTLQAERASGRPSAALAGALIAVGRCEDALAIGSKHADVVFSFDMVIACLSVGKPEEGLEWALRGKSEHPKEFLYWAFLAAAQAALGRKQEAEQSIATVTKMFPGFSTDAFERSLNFGWQHRKDIVEPTMLGLRSLTAG